VIPTDDDWGLASKEEPIGLDLGIDHDIFNPSIGFESLKARDQFSEPRYPSVDFGRRI
jgi:hypothetical protein